MNKSVTVVGAGLAGCEAAYQLAKRGIEVTLFEMKPSKRQSAHKSDDFAELVCSNSLRSDRLQNGAGLLKEELRRMDSLIMRAADETRVPAGGALAVDRVGFSRRITEIIRSDPHINIIEREIEEIPNGPAIIATGPLTDGKLLLAIEELLGDSLHFYDAAAPVVTAESLDMDKVFRASRYERGSDYLNCPMTKEEYFTFVKELVGAETAPLREFETLKVFEGCMPVEVMAKRGEMTLAYGPLKPVGLMDERTGVKPFAVVQLRQDDKEARLYNIVGFQTHLTWGEQKRVFSMIPALKNAEFVRYGVMHRNTYLNSPKLLDRYYRLKSEPRLSFAGQMTGVEGYVESAASGMLVGIETAARVLGLEPVDFPQETAIGALSLYISGGSVGDFQPMNVNFGIISPLGYRVKGKRNKNAEISARSLAIIEELMKKEVFGLENNN